MTVRVATGNTRCDKHDDRLNPPLAAMPESRQEKYESVLKNKRLLKLLLDVEKTVVSAKDTTIKALARVYKRGTAYGMKALTITGDFSGTVRHIIKRNGDSSKIDSENSYMLVFQENEEFHRFIENLTEEKAREKVQKVEEETRAAKKAAEIAVSHAEGEIKKLKKEAKKAENDAQLAISLAREQSEKDIAALEEIKRQSQVAVIQAQADAAKVKVEAEQAHKDSQEAISRAQLESRRAKKEAEEAIKKAEEAIAQAEQRALVRAFEEINKAKEEAGTAKNMAFEVIAKAREESRQAREEAEIVKEASEEAIRQTREESRKAKEEAEITKQAAVAAISKAQLESQKVKEEAASNAFIASEAMKKATHDIIRHTQNEISQTRQEIEEVSKNPAAVLDKPLKASMEADGSLCQSDKVDSQNMAAVLHEMRAPLHSISGFARLMLEDNVTDGMTQKEFLSIMVQQSDSLNRLLDDLSGRLGHNTEAFSINKEPVSSHKLITEAVSSVPGIASQKKNLINCNITPSLPEVEADESRIKQVIINLITNAIKFSHDNGTIDIKAEAQNNKLLIQVRDHGIGIPRTDIPFIFNKYYRAKNCGEVPGQGLGLYICRQIVEAHGGHIWVESVEGEGSTFSITLHLVPASSK